MAENPKETRAHARVSLFGGPAAKADAGQAAEPVLAETTWSDGGKRLTVAWPDGKQAFDFTTGDDGRTRFTLSQNGKPVVAVK